MTTMQFLENSFYILAGVMCLLGALAAVCLAAKWFLDGTRKERAKSAIEKSDWFAMSASNPGDGRNCGSGNGCKSCWCSTCKNLEKCERMKEDITPYEIAENFKSPWPCLGCDGYKNRMENMEEPTCDKDDCEYTYEPMAEEHGKDLLHEQLWGWMNL